MGGEIITLQLGCADEAYASSFWDVQALATQGDAETDATIFFEESPSSSSALLRARTVCWDVPSGPEDRPRGGRSSGGPSASVASTSDAEAANASAASLTWDGGATVTPRTESASRGYAHGALSRLVAPRAGAGALLRPAAAWSRAAGAASLDSLAGAECILDRLDEQDLLEDALRREFEAADAPQGLLVLCGAARALGFVAAREATGLRDALGAKAVVLVDGARAWGERLRVGEEGDGEGEGERWEEEDEADEDGADAEERARRGGAYDAPSDDDEMDAVEDTTYRTAHRRRAGAAQAAATAADLEDAVLLAAAAESVDAHVRVGSLAGLEPAGAGPSGRSPPSVLPLDSPWRGFVLASAAAPWSAARPEARGRLGDWAAARRASAPEVAAVTLVAGLRPHERGDGEACSGAGGAKSPRASKGNVGARGERLEVPWRRSVVESWTPQGARLRDVQAVWHGPEREDLADLFDEPSGGPSRAGFRDAGPHLSHPPSSAPLPPPSPAEARDALLDTCPDAYRLSGCAVRRLGVPSAPCTAEWDDEGSSRSASGRAAGPAARGAGAGGAPAFAQGGGSASAAFAQRGGAAPAAFARGVGAAFVPAARRVPSSRRAPVLSLAGSAARPAARAARRGLGALSSGRAGADPELRAALRRLGPEAKELESKLLDLLDASDRI